MPSARQQGLLDDLRYLRKGAGLTLARLARATAVVQACGGADQPMETVRERLLSAVRSLDDERDRAALLSALNTEQQPLAQLKQRRQAFADTVGRAPYTVAEWEDKALDELALRLLTSYYAGSATPAQLHLPHGGFLLRRLEVRTLIRGRRFVESRQVRDVVSLVEGAKGFVYGTYSTTVLSDLTGCSLRESRQAPGGVIHELLFPGPLRRGHMHRFAFVERVPEEERATEPPEVDFAGQTFETPTLQYLQEVTFEGEQPQMIWPYDKLSRIERPGRPINLMSGPSVTRSFQDLYGGLASGIAWVWRYPCHESGSGVGSL